MDLAFTPRPHQKNFSRAHPVLPAILHGVERSLFHIFHSQRIQILPPVVGHPQPVHFKKTAAVEQFAGVLQRREEEEAVRTAVRDLFKRTAVFDDRRHDFKFDFFRHELSW